MSHPNRRQFHKAGAAGLLTALSASRVYGANDRVRLGFIGLGNRGDQVLDAFRVHKDCEAVALCDIYQSYVDFAAKKAGGSPTKYDDYHKLLDNKEVDAAVICTPDHWHALQMIEACEAGKDVYVEKPLSLCVAEGRAMVQAVRKNKRVTQVGLHRRSSAYCRDAADFVRKGGIGHVTVCRAFHIQNETPKGIGNPPNGDPPKNFNWNAWLGPAPKVPYNKNRTFYRFRWFYDYSGGQLTNFGIHYLDVIHWRLVTTRLSQSPRWAANTRWPTTARSPIPWRCSGSIRATLWSRSLNSTPPPPRLPVTVERRSNSEAQKERST